MQRHGLSFGWVGVMLVGLLCCGCGGTGATSTDLSRAADSFTLNVLPESFIDGTGSGNFSVDTAQRGTETVISVRVDDARALKALYFDLSYDAQAFQPIGVAAMATLAPTDRLATLTALARPGVVSHGQVVFDPDSAPGFNGSGVLAVVRFRSGPARMVRQTPGSGSLGQVSWDPLTHTLSWHYYNQGDYDQNGEVNAADLTPLARYIYQVGPFAPFSIREVVDGDGNGEINLADITPIGLNFGAAVLSYRVYKSGNPEDAPTVSDEPSAIAPAAEVMSAEAQGNRLSERLWFSCEHGGIHAGDYFWARPVGGGGGERGMLGMAGGTSEVTLSLLSLPLSGDGTQGLPYVLEATSEYLFQVMHSVLGDVSTDPATTYTLDPATAGTLTNVDATLRIAVGFTGNFTVSATYDGLQAQPPFIYCLVEPPVVVNLPPVAAITATPNNGDAPLSVVLDASASTDPDGTITTYEWDFTGDGIYDANTGATPTVSTVYPVPGTYVARVRVTDDDGATDTAECSITARATGWDVIDISSAGWDGGWPQLVDAGGKPGLVYVYESDVDFETPYEVRYRRATDASGTAWTAPLTISPAAHDATAVADAIVVDGCPAALYQSYEGYEHGLYFQRAGDAQGDDWPSPIRLDNGAMSGAYSQLQIVAGNPGVVYVNVVLTETDYWSSLSFIRASDPQGSLWGAPHYLYATLEDSDLAPSFDLIDGRPAITYFDHYTSTVDLLQATDALGTTWGEPRELLDEANGSYNPMLFAGAKTPTLVFQGPAAELRYLPASDMQANTFAPVKVLDDRVQHYVWDYGPRMAWVGAPGAEVPAIAYLRDGELNGDLLTTQVMYIQAADAQGSTWLAPEIVYVGEWTCMQVDLVAINGEPHLAWTDSMRYVTMYASRNAVLP